MQLDTIGTDSWAELHTTHLAIVKIADISYRRYKNNCKTRIIWKIHTN